MKICPKCGFKEEKKVRELTDIQRIIKGWKMLNHIPTEGEDSSNWDKVFFARNSRSAKQLIELFGNWGTAWDCVEYVYNVQKKSKLDCTLETCVKRSDLFREQLARNGQ